MPTMQAMALQRPRRALVMSERPIPTPAPGEIMVMVTACGVCRTDLHVVDGELTNPVLPIVPGHEIVGHVRALGTGVGGFAIGDRVGVPWLGATCGICPYCRGNRENLCDNPVFTGYTRDGGFATHVIADARFCFRLGEAGEDAEIAPWLCAGLIGWRSYRRAGEGTRSVSMGSERQRISSPRSRNGTADVCLLSPVRAIKSRRTCALPRCRMGGRIRRLSARTTRCRDHIRTRRCIAAGCSQGGEEGWSCRVWRHPHVRHSKLSLCAAVAGTRSCRGGQSYSCRRARVPGNCAEGRSEVPDNALSLAAGQ
jgi:Alcohol dehydrogenase GroES-like domain